MQNKTSVRLGVSLLIAALVVVGGYFLLRPHAANTSVATDDGQFATTTLANGVTVVTKGGAKGVITIQPVQPAVSVPAPSLNRKASFSSSLSADRVAQLRSDEAATIAVLKKNPGQTNYWLQLANDYKAAGDYDGTIEILNYLTKVTPSNYVPFANLGDIYQNFSVNYPKAEANYLQAIKLNPQGISSYSNIFTLYRYQYKTNTSAAADIVAQGLKANPGNKDLLNMQAQLKGSAQ